jgi:SAM-dependent methyltransferase
VKNQKNYRGQEPWPYLLFIKYAHLYLPEMLRMEEKAEPEVLGICKILDEFKIEKGTRILDFACGIGRHSIRLSKIGYEVVGYDPSYFFLEKAREKVRLEPSNIKIKFYEGNPYHVYKILSRKNEADFRAIIIMFNSIGYSTIKEDLKIFKNLLNLSSKNGTILITQTENRDWRIKNFEPCIISDYGTIQLHEQWTFNLEDSISEGILRFYRKKNLILHPLLELPIRLRLYSLHELKGILYQSGWNFLKSYGNISTLEQASTDSTGIVTVSTNKISQ